MLFNFFSVSLAVTEPDSTIVYYNLSTGFVPPKPPGQTENTKKSQQQNSRSKIMENSIRESCSVDKTGQICTTSGNRQYTCLTAQQPCGAFNDVNELQEDNNSSHNKDLNTCTATSKRLFECEKLEDSVVLGESLHHSSQDFEAREQSWGTEAW